MSKACGWKSSSGNPRRHSVIHRCDAPRSIRGQRNPERRNSRLQSVQGQRNPERRQGRPQSVRGRRNPEHREPLLKPVDGILHSNFTSTEQKSALLHPQDVGVDDDDEETTATTQQAAVREEFVSPSEKLQRQGTPTWATEKHKLFDTGRSLSYNYFPEKRNVLSVYCLSYFVCAVYRILSALSIVFFPFCPRQIPKQVRKAK